jgi:hypothetical protein
MSLEVSMVMKKWIVVFWVMMAGTLKIGKA